MSTAARKTVQLGELVVAAFDVAARFSIDPQAPRHRGGHADALVSHGCWPVGSRQKARKARSQVYTTVGI